MFQPSEDAESHHLTAVFREASLDAINRAMHHDMYLVPTITRTDLTSYSSVSKYINLRPNKTFPRIYTPPSQNI